MKSTSFLKSLNHAAEGFIYVVKHERNMRVHFLFGFLVLLVALLLGVRRVEWMILCGVISLVLITEMLNTAVEETVDWLEKSTHHKAKIIKDVSAGAVLVSALNALVVGALIFSKYWTWPFQVMMFRIRNASWQVIFLALLVVVFFVILAKARFRRGTPFRGGAVSGHSAVAFSLWTAVLFMQSSFFLIGVTLLLALLVAQSRLRAKIHSFWEVAAGSRLGFFTKALFFRVFK